MKKNYLKRSISLSRRIQECKEREVDLMLENAQLRDTLSLYENFFGDSNHVVATTFNAPLDKRTVDMLIRLSPSSKRIEVYYLKGGREVDSSELYELLGTLDMAKSLITEIVYKGTPDDDDRQEN